MSRVALVYDRSCPHVAAARDQIRAAFSLAGLPAEWEEWDRDSRKTPTELRPFGSPTILVDGRDVATGGDVEPALPTANSCRVYVDDAGLAAVPPVSLIVNALMKKAQARPMWGD